jgi:hypothetical protein
MSPKVARPNTVVCQHRDICLSQTAIVDNFAKKLFNVNEPLLENIDKHISLSKERGNI